MRQSPFRTLALLLIALAALPAFNQPALACPPMICRKFDIETARSLPWGGTESREAKTDYNISRLVEETLAALGPETSVIVRMETLRRATVYAVWAMVDEEVGITVKDLTIAHELIERLKARARSARGTAAESLALFDLGYLMESYKGSMTAEKIDGFKSGLDGYSLIVKATALRAGDPEMEFASAIVTDPGRAEHQRHLQKALAGSSRSALLARNLALHFGFASRSAR
jgi:hypothetical protein